MPVSENHGACGVVRHVQCKIATNALELLTVLGLVSNVALPPAYGAMPVWPQKPIRFIVPTQPAGPSDMLARTLAQKLGPMWGQTVVIDNRGGAGGTLGTDIAAKSAPDGHTLLLASAAAVINVTLYARLPYNFATDFAPITQIGATPFVLVTNMGVPAKSVQELIALAKLKPGTLTYGSAGVGVASHLAGAIFQSSSGIDVVHVPYKGQAPATTDLIAGQIAYMFNNPITALPQVKAGRIRALAVSGAKRFPLLPDVPTVAESGLSGFDVTIWFSVVTGAGTPRSVIDQLHGQIVNALHMPDVRERLEAQGVGIIANTPEEFARVIKADIAKWAIAVKASGARAD
jgi:tripartite-type tricarboxylate transporter receptor subunit TctC